jgi:fibronectin-binding autotransporter adhesin
MAGDLYVGSSGAANELVVSNGGVVRNAVGYLGLNSTSSNNVAAVTGAGSLWTNVGFFYVGYSGWGNQLVVTNGGRVQSAAFNYLGYNPSSSNNVAVVTGAGSGWTNVGDLYVGYFGSGNQLALTNGAVVSSGKGYIGLAVEGTSNVAVVTGLGSLWTLGSELQVGATGSGNRLVVSDSGAVRNAVGNIGLFGSNNVALVTGAGSAWTNVGDFNLGYFGSGNQLVVTNGGVVQNAFQSFVGRDIASSNNLATVTGAGSVWSSAGELLLGYSGAANQLVVSNGGVVQNLLSGYVGFFANNNAAIVTGTGSVWSNVSLLRVGRDGSGNQLTVSDGGVVRSVGGVLGSSVTGSNNLAVVTGAGSLWTNASLLTLGDSGSGNQLVVSNGGTVFAYTTVTLGLNSTSTDNRLITDGGTLRVTNIGLALFNIRRGTNVLNAGTNDVDRLVMTNAAGRFEFNGGTLIVRTSTVNNGVVFTVGNGTSTATLQLRGGSNVFTSGITIANHATLTGNGTVGGGVTVQSGGALSPGDSIGRLVLSNSPSLQGATLMEISKNEIVRTNDQVQVAGLLTYGGSLIVSDLGPTTLAAGDRFQLFSANTYGGSFTALTLPPLNGGLGWTNKLLLDGSIEVVGVASPQFSNVTMAGTNVIITGSGGTPGANYTVLSATNVVEPLSNWVSLVTNQFDPNGNFLITNGIASGELQRYFRIRVP